MEDGSVNNKKEVRYCAWVQMYLLLFLFSYFLYGIIQVQKDFKPQYNKQHNLFLIIVCSWMNQSTSMSNQHRVLVIKEFTR